MEHLTEDCFRLQCELKREMRILIGQIFAADSRQGEIPREDCVAGQHVGVRAI